MNRFLWVSVAALAAVGSLSGCNTARGLGADIEVLGQIIQGKAVPEGEVISVTETMEQAPPRLVQPGDPVAVYPYQAPVQSSVYPLPSAPAEPLQMQMPTAVTNQGQPTLGAVPPAPKPVNVKEM